MSLRERWVNSIKRIFFIPGEQQRLVVPKSKADQMSLLYFHCFLSPKIHLPLKPPAKRKKIGTGISKALADVVVEEVNFSGGLVSSMRRKELT